MSKSVLYVGSDFPGGVVEEVSFSSRRSLLDFDVVLFEPPEIHSARRYQGKSSLDEAESFRLRESCDHWRGEISEALAAGKTVIIFLEPYRDFFVDSGERKFSGTGRNQQTTILVQPFDNYRWMPTRLEGMTPAAGKAIKPGKDLGVLAPFWSSYSKLLEYNIYFSDPSVSAALVTKTGNKAVGGVMASGNGFLVFLPPVDWDWDALVKVDPKTDREVWTSDGKKAGHTLLEVALKIDAALHESDDKTPTPEWAETDAYSLDGERRLRTEIGELNAQIETLRERIATKRTEAVEAGRLRALLYANGRELERALILALRILGFDASGFQDEDSEFDIVFSSSEGRFLGEAEGKDSKPVNVDKLRQLEMNIQEDFARDEVRDYATGVLFGNAFRLTDPVERDSLFFTDKCLTAAKRSGVVLVRTVDLFAPARFVSENSNSKTYAKQVRRAIAKSIGGLAAIPAPPEPKKTDVSSV